MDRDQAGIWERGRLVRLDTGQLGMEREDLQGPALAQDIATASQSKDFLFVVRAVSELSRI